MPLEAPRPVPTIMAVGVAKPKAQGQDTTSTETAMVKANSHTGPANQPDNGRHHCNGNDDGDEHPRHLSASLAMGALELVASSTSRMIWARAVSSPTLVACMVKYPLWLMVAPMTLSPGCLSTGCFPR